MKDIIFSILFAPLMFFAILFIGITTLLSFIAMPFIWLYEKLTGETND